MARSIQLFLITALYLAFTIVLKWQGNYSWMILLYVGGFAVGLNLIVFIENILKTSPEIVKSLFAQLLIHVLTIFVLTSSTSLFGKGVMLGLHVEQLFVLHKAIQVKKWKRWFYPNVLTPQNSYRVLQWLWGVFVIYTLLFILI